MVWTAWVHTWLREMTLSKEDVWRSRSAYGIELCSAMVVLDVRALAQIEEGSERQREWRRERMWEGRSSGARF